MVSLISEEDFSEDNYVIRDNQYVVSFNYSIIPFIYIKWKSVVKKKCSLIMQGCFYWNIVLAEIKK